MNILIRIQLGLVSLALIAACSNKNSASQPVAPAKKAELNQLPVIGNWVSDPEEETGDIVTMEVTADSVKFTAKCTYEADTKIAQATAKAEVTAKAIKILEEAKDSKPIYMDGDEQRPLPCEVVIKKQEVRYQIEDDQLFMVEDEEKFSLGRREKK